MPDYWLDSDTLIRPNRELTFDWLPSLWAILRQKGAKGILASSVFVYEELKDGNDTLAEWAGECQSFGLWVPAGESVQRAYSAIADYVAQHQAYSPEHKATFLGKADAWIIAHALALWRQGGDVRGISAAVGEAQNPGCRWQFWSGLLDAT